MKDLKHPAKPLFRSESDVDVTIHSDEESEAEEDYHNWVSSIFVGSRSVLSMNFRGYYSCPSTFAELSND